VAERIRRAFEASETPFEGRTLKITMSVGVASAQGLATNPISVLAARADEALYNAKHGGRNRVAHHSLPAAHAVPIDDDEEDTEITRVSALPGH
jgi:diguanylate cyclase (GGDEF)-like protein